MRNLCLAAVMLVSLTGIAKAQSTGGLDKLSLDIFTQARVGAAMDLKQHATGVMFLPWRYTSADGTIEYGCLGFGADMGAGAVGNKMHGAPLFIPMLNAPALAARYLTGPHSHPPVLKNLEGGIGIKPVPISGVHGKWIIGNQIEGVVTYGF